MGEVNILTAARRLLSVFDLQRMTTAERIICGVSDAGLRTEGNAAIEALRIAALTAAPASPVSGDVLTVPREELADFADVIGNLIGELSDPGTGALAAHYRIKAMLNAAPAAPSAGWRTIESAPFEKMVLVDCDRFDVCEAIQYHGAGWKTFGANGPYSLVPTAWMEKSSKPLPAAPSEDKPC